MRASAHSNENLCASQGDPIQAEIPFSSIEWQKTYLSTFGQVVSRSLSIIDGVGEILVSNSATVAHSFLSPASILNLNLKDAGVVGNAFVGLVFLHELGHLVQARSVGGFENLIDAKIELGADGSKVIERHADFIAGRLAYEVLTLGAIAPYDPGNDPAVLERLRQSGSERVNAYGYGVCLTFDECPDGGFFDGSIYNPIPSDDTKQFFDGLLSPSTNHSGWVTQHLPDGGTAPVNVEGYSLGQVVSFPDFGAAMLRWAMLGSASAQAATHPSPLERVQALTDGFNSGRERILVEAIALAARDTGLDAYWNPK